MTVVTQAEYTISIVEDIHGWAVFVTSPNRPYMFHAATLEQGMMMLSLAIMESQNVEPTLGILDAVIDGQK